MPVVVVVVLVVLVVQAVKVLQLLLQATVVHNIANSVVTAKVPISALPVQTLLEAVLFVLAGDQRLLFVIAQVICAIALTVNRRQQIFTTVDLVAAVVQAALVRVTTKALGLALQALPPVTQRQNVSIHVPNYA